MDEQLIKNVVEASLLAAGRPLSMDQILSVFGDGPRPDRKKVRKALDSLTEEYADRGMEILEVASGFRIQIQSKYIDFISRLWEERPPRYSRASMETLALIAYRQPITRGEIEEVRGVSVSTNIIRSLLERNWIRVVGHRDVPGKPEMFGTTKEFLDYFSLKRLDDLPTLAEIRDIDPVNAELDFANPELQDVVGDEHSDEIETDHSDDFQAHPVSNDTDLDSPSLEDESEAIVLEAAVPVVVTSYTEETTDDVSIDPEDVVESA